MSDLKLSPNDRQSPLWVQIKAALEARLQELRLSLEVDMAPEKSAKIRGQISEVKRMLDWEKDKPTVEKFIQPID